MAAALVYALLSVLLYAPALLPGHTLSASDYLWTAAPWASERPSTVPAFGSNYELVDSAVQFQPWLEYASERLPNAPLWNTHVGAGRPFLANAQSAVLSPFSLPTYLLPFWWSLGVVAVLKVFTAAFGTYLLARSLGMRFAGALLSGLVYAFGLYFVVWVAWPQTSVWALLPWLFLTADQVIRRPGALSAAGLAVVVALQFFGGHPESSFHLLAATVAFFAFRLFMARREGADGRVWRPALAFCAALVGGITLAAVTLLPFVELLFRSADVEVRETYSELALPREYLLGFALPDYWGRATEAAVGAFAQERALYVGALPLMLAIGALILRPTLLRLGLALFGAFMLAVVVGVPPLPDLAGAIPIVRTGNHLRLVIILVLCVAVLAGFGLDDLTAQQRRRGPMLIALALGLLLLPLVALAIRGQLSASRLGDALQIAVGFNWPSPPPDAEGLTTVRMAALIVWLTVAGLATLLLSARVLGRIGATTLVVLALALVAADLFKAGMGATPGIDTDSAVQPATPAIDYLKSRRPNRFVGLDRPFGPSPLIPNTALRWSLYDARSYDLPVEERYDALWRRAIIDGGPTDHPTSQAHLTAQALPALRLLSVSDIAQDPDEPRVRDPALPLAYDRSDLRVYANPRALPRAGLVSAQRVVPGDEAQLEAVLKPSFDGRRTVVTGTPLPGLSATPQADPAGSARLVDYEPERVVVEVRASHPAELVLTDLHFPGWRVEVDGQEADLHRVNYLLRGTSVTAGSHRIEFRYKPLAWRLGRILSLLALLTLLAVLAVGLRRRRGAGGRPAPTGS